jgi:hypothetical protein
MSEDRKSDHQGQSVQAIAANDDRPSANPNSPWARHINEHAPLLSNSSEAGRFPRILTDWPERLPVIQAESDLIVAYLSDLIGKIIANDNGEG